MKRLVLIDGYGIVFKSHFGIKKFKKDGSSIGATLGFTQALLGIKNKLKYSHIAVVFDTGVKTFRHSMYNDYKANRAPCPLDLIPQFELVRESAKMLGMKVLEKAGYEADDLIATWTKKAKASDFEVVIISIDKDLMQLVDEKVKVYDFAKNKFIEEKDVIEKWGVKPQQILDVLSLKGDSSDNVPGVKGIGEKTAVKLVNEFGGIDNLISNIHNIKKQSDREKIKNDVDNLKLSKKLITLEENVPCECCIDDLCFKCHNEREFSDFLKKHELSYLGGLL